MTIPRPEPPYWVVVFTTQLREGAAGYEEAAHAMVERAGSFPGMLGIESARGADGVGVTCSYWRTREDFERWRDDPVHTATRERGRRDWYEWYELRIAEVERATHWARRPSETAQGNSSIASPYE